MYVCRNETNVTVLADRGRMSAKQPDLEVKGTVQPLPVDGYCKAPRIEFATKRTMRVGTKRVSVGDAISRVGCLLSTSIVSGANEIFVQ
jgi:hypothetical protein